MITVELTKEQVTTLLDSLGNRIDVLYNCMEAYSRQKNAEAAQDCLNEIRKAKALQEMLRNESKK